MRARLARVAVRSPAPAVTLRGHRDDALWGAYSPNGQTLASANSDGTLKLWHASAGPYQAALDGHRGIVRCVAFSTDGRRLASAGADGWVVIDGERSKDDIAADVMAAVTPRLSRP